MNGVSVLTCVVDELGSSLHAGVSIVVVAKMEGPYPSTEHLGVLLRIVTNIS